MNLNSPRLSLAQRDDSACSFASSADFGNLVRGLRAVGFNEEELEKVMGLNWYRFFESSFGRQEPAT